MRSINFGGLTMSFAQENNSLVNNDSAVMNSWRLFWLPIFRGRLSRINFISFAGIWTAVFFAGLFLSSTLISVVTDFILPPLSSNHSVMYHVNINYHIDMVLLFVAAVYLFCINIGFVVRRLHDAGISAWLLPLLLVPLINIVFMGALYFCPSEKDVNKYGARDINFANKRWVHIFGITVVVVMLVALAIGAILVGANNPK